MARSPTQDRYSTVAIILHWLIAGALAAQVMLGWRMGAFDGFTRTVLLQIHKSVGISILLLSLARLAWRLINPPPALPPTSPALERRIARIAHKGFYAAMIVLPLTGWALASLGRPGGMKLFGLLPWPAFPGLSSLALTTQDNLAAVMGTLHSALSWVMIALVALHVAGALKHQFIARDGVVSRMAPGLKSWADPRLSLIPLTGLALAALVYLPAIQAPPPRPKVTNLAHADVYLDVVGPALNRRCGACHNGEEARGGLSLASYDDLAQGAADGPVVRPFDASHSELFKRISLPASHARYMPKDGKTPLSPDEVVAIHWWIAEGARRDTQVGQLKLTPEARAALQKILSADEAAPADDGSAHAIALPNVPAAPPEAVRKLVADGFVMRRANDHSNLLEADYTAKTPVTDEIMADLAKVGPQLIKLNLRHAGVTDGMARSLAGFANLRHLRLESNPIDDAAAADLAGLTSLTYLNVANTQISPAGAQRLAALPRLRRLYVWGSQVSPEAAKTIRMTHADLAIDGGLTAKDVVVETHTVAPIN